MPGDIITHADIRKSGYCSRGIRQWFGLRGFNYNQFLDEGIPAETLTATGDAFALKVVADKAARNG